MRQLAALVASCVLVAIALLQVALAAWVILARADFVAPGAESAAIRAATWAFAALFALNTLGNLASRSRAERLVMSPLTVVLTVCFVMVAAGSR